MAALMCIAVCVCVCVCEWGLEQQQSHYRHNKWPEDIFTGSCAAALRLFDSPSLVDSLSVFGLILCLMSLFLHRFPSRVFTSNCCFMSFHKLKLSSSGSVDWNITSFRISTGGQNDKKNQIKSNQISFSVKHLILILIFFHFLWEVYFFRGEYEAE